MAAIAWDTIENALVAWVVAATGLAAGNVIWAYQKGPRPAKPFISMQISDLAQVGHDWRLYDDAEDPEEGAELRVRARGLRTARLQLQCFAADDSLNEAVRLLADAVSGLALNEYNLDEAGIGIGSTDAIQLLEGRRGGILEPRSIVNVSLHLGSEVEARETYIERINLVLTESTIGEVADLWIPDPPPPES